MRLLDFIEKQDAERLVAHLASELPFWVLEVTNKAVQGPAARHVIEKVPDRSAWQWQKFFPFAG